MDGINISGGFNLNAPTPIDTRFVVNTLNELNSIETIKRYEGLTVYVKSEEVSYQLTGGIENSNWKLTNSSVHIGEDEPSSTNILWVDPTDETASGFLNSSTGEEMRNVISEIAQKVNKIGYAIEYELDPGYFNGILPGTSEDTQGGEQNTPDLDDGASGTVGRILIKRGLKSEIESLHEGEFGWCIDTNELYIGSNGKLILLNSGGGGSSGNVTADYIELVSSQGTRFRLTVNDVGDPIIFNSRVDTAALPDKTDAGRFSGLFINKVYAGGARDTNNTPVSHGFIELYNTTSSVINLRGLSLQYGEYLKPWEVLPLRGEVKPYSSFLIRCAQHSDPYRRDVRCKILDFDMSWNIPLSVNGYKIYLTVGTDATTFQNPANTDGQWSKASGYINLFAAGGNDTTKIIDGYEREYGHLITKDRMLRRRFSETLTSAFANTGNNFDDIEYVDMTVADLSIYAPRSSRFGQWDHSFDQSPLDPNVPNVVSVGFGQDGNTTRTFTWQTVPTKYGYVQYKKKGATDWKQVESEKKFVAHPDFVDVTIHKTIVRGFEPGNTYVYRVGSEGHWSDEADLVIKDVRDETTPIRVLWTSDQQSWSDHEYYAWEKANKYIENDLKLIYDYDFMINTGDRTQNANRSCEWRGYFNSAKNNFRTHVEMSTVGNNDLVDKLYSYAYDYYATVENAVYPSVFSWNYGMCHFICLDSNIVKDPVTGVSIRGVNEQIEFIRNDMRNPENQKPWVIAFCHESCYTIIRSDKMKPLIDVLYDCGVDLVLCGHHHCYTRSHRMGKLGLNDEDTLDGTNGVYYLMMQATGFKLAGKTTPTPASQATWRALYERPGDPCFGTITFTRDRIEYKAYRLAGITPLEDNVNNEPQLFQFDTLTITPRVSKNQLYQNLRVEMD